MNVKTAAVNTTGALSIAAGLAAAANPQATAADASKGAKPTSSLVATDGNKVLEVDKSTKPAVTKAKKTKEATTTTAPATVTGTEKAKAKETTTPKAKTEAKKPAKAADKKVEVKEENAKKLKAKKIFDKNISKSAGEIAGMIAKELEITYSNAYYYVTRVFGKKSKKAA